MVKQHQELDRLYSHSINTIRVQTYIDENGSVKIKLIFLRFGIGGSRVDNTDSGGGWVPVNLDGSIKSYAYGAYGLAIGEQHPDSGIKYSDLTIPHFKDTIKLCKKAHRSFPYNRIIGWDVFIGENGNPKLIEWNANNPGFWDAEAIYGPFFSELIEY